MSKRFKAQDYKRYKKLGQRWRRPVGRHSKLKINKGGSGLVPRIGYRTPNAVRFLAKITDSKGASLAKTHLVHSMNELEKMQKGEHIILASSIGKRKVVLLADKAKQLGVHIVNSQRARSAKRMQKTIAYRKDLAKKERQKAEEQEKKEKQKRTDANEPTLSASKHTGVKTVDEKTKTTENKE